MDCTNKFINFLAEEYLNNYAKENNEKLQISNSFNEDYSGTLLLETSYDNLEILRTIIYSNTSITNEISSIDIPNQLENDGYTGVIQNSYFVMNMNIYASNKFESSIIEYPFVKEYEFIVNPNIKVKYEKLLETEYIKELYPYTIEKSVYRNNTLVYYPNTRLYLLIDNNKYKIYIMYMYSNVIDSEISLDNLSLLQQKLKLPEGWLYVSYLLDNNFVSVPSNGNAKVITDDLNNLYQYLDENSLFGKKIYQDLL